MYESGGYVTFCKDIQKDVRKYFTGHTRSVKAKKNILLTFLFKGCSICISLMLVPLTINYVNPTGYGIWLTLSSIIAWTSFFDIGFGNGLRYKFAEALAKGDYKLARIYVSTTYAILGIIIGTVLLVFIVINPFISWIRIINAPPEMALELTLLALIVFVFFCLQFIFQLVNVVLMADQNPGKISLFKLIGSVCSLIVIFVLTKTTKGSLLYLGITMSAVPVVVLAISSMWFYLHEYRKFSPSLKYVQFKYARNLMELGIKFFIIQIAVILLYQTNNIIIVQLFGPAEVTPYNIAYRYFGVLTMVFTIILSTFWSAFTEAWVKEDKKWITNIIRRIKYLWFVLTITALFMVLVSNKIYSVWVGHSIHVPFSLSVAIAMYVVILMFTNIYNHFLNGVGKIKLQLYSGIMAAMLNVPLAILLGKQIGITGIVIANCLVNAPSLIYYPMQYKKIMNNKAYGIWDK